VEEETQW